MVALTRLPSLMYSSTARILSSYEYMNYLLVIQDFVRIPELLSGSPRIPPHPPHHLTTLRSSVRLSAADQAPDRSSALTPEIAGRLLSECEVFLAARP